MTDTSMVERVAKAASSHFVRMWGRAALYAVLKGENWDGPPVKDGLPEQEAYALARTLNARAAIEAIREPTLNQSLVGMAALMEITGHAFDPDDADPIWKAMIDAALSET